MGEDILCREILFRDILQRETLSRDTLFPGIFYREIFYREILYRGILYLSQIVFKILVTLDSFQDRPVITTFLQMVFVNDPGLALFKAPLPVEPGTRPVIIARVKWPDVTGTVFQK
jgi:hypothetical protein